MSYDVIVALDTDKIKSIRIVLKLHRKRYVLPDVYRLNTFDIWRLNTMLFN